MLGCRPLSEGEIEDVLECFGGPFAHRDRLLFVLGCATGFRVSELLSLAIGSVWRSGRMRSEVRVSRKNTKGKKSGRTVPLCEAVDPFLRACLGARALAGPLEPREPLFISRKGAARPISRIQAYRILRDAFDAAGIDLSTPGTHTLRKTFASRVFESLHGDIFLTQHALGHKSPSSTLAYLSPDMPAINAAISKAFTAPLAQRPSG